MLQLPPKPTSSSFPPPSIPPGSPFPSANLTPGPASALSSQLHLPTRDPATTTTAAPTAHPGGTSCPVLPREAAHSLVVGERWGTQPTAGKRESRQGVWESQPQPPTYTLLPLPFFCKPGHGSTACCIKCSLPPALAPSHPLPCQPFIQLVSSGQICQHHGCFSTFCIHLFCERGRCLMLRPLRAVPPRLSFHLNTSSSSRQMLSSVFEHTFSETRNAKEQYAFSTRGFRTKLGMVCHIAVIFKEPAASIWLP